MNQNTQSSPSVAGRCGRFVGQSAQQFFAPLQDLTKGFGTKNPTTFPFVLVLAVVSLGAGGMAQARFGTLKSNTTREYANFANLKWRDLNTIIIEGSLSSDGFGYGGGGGGGGGSGESGGAIVTLHTPQLFPLKKPVDKFPITTNSTLTTYLNWNPVSDTNLAGYRVYYVDSLGVANVIKDVGQETAVEIQGMEPNKSYSFAVTAYNTYGVESGLSQEVSILRTPDSESPIQFASRARADDDPLLGKFPPPDKLFITVNRSDNFSDLLRRFGRFSF